MEKITELLKRKDWTYDDSHAFRTAANRLVKKVNGFAYESATDVGWDNFPRLLNYYKDVFPSAFSKASYDADHSYYRRVSDYGGVTIIDEKIVSENDLMIIGWRTRLSSRLEEKLSSDEKILFRFLESPVLRMTPGDIIHGWNPCSYDMRGWLYTSHGITAARRPSRKKK